MSATSVSPVILIANNPLGHHLLTSQLLDGYSELNLDCGVVLLCNGVMANTDPARYPGVKVISFASPAGGLFSHLNLLLQLLVLRRRYPNAAYHLRGFVSGFVFCLSQFFVLGAARYIYDPRGAFFIEWREAGRSRAVSKLFGWIEARLIRHSVVTIVTTNRFARLYRRLFGHGQKYLTIYNSTSFSYRDRNVPLPSEGPLRFVYLGTFNHWHDMGEIARVMACIASQIGPERTEISVYTPANFHAAARKAFGGIACSRLTIDYVNYHEIPATLADKHVGVSVVRPTLSTCIASAIKVSDYTALGLVPLINTGIGDFDSHFRAAKSAILYQFGGPIDVSGLPAVRTSENRKIYNLVSRSASRERLLSAVSALLNRHFA